MLHMENFVPELFSGSDRVEVIRSAQDKSDPNRRVFVVYEKKGARVVNATSDVISYTISDIVKTFENVRGTISQSVLAGSFLVQNFPQSAPVTECDIGSEAEGSVAMRKALEQWYDLYPEQPTTEELEAQFEALCEEHGG